MGLFDNISSGLGSLASEINPRNTAADLAMIEYNAELQKDNAARWAQSANLSQTEYDRDIKLAIQKNKQDGFLLRNVNNTQHIPSALRTGDPSGRRRGSLPSPLNPVGLSARTLFFVFFP